MSVMVLTNTLTDQLGDLKKLCRVVCGACEALRTVPACRLVVFDPTVSYGKCFRDE